MPIYAYCAEIFGLILSDAKFQEQLFTFWNNIFTEEVLAAQDEAFTVFVGEVFDALQALKPGFVEREEFVGKLGAPRGKSRKMAAALTLCRLLLAPSKRKCCVATSERHPRLQVLAVLDVGSVLQQLLVAVISSVRRGPRPMWHLPVPSEDRLIHQPVLVAVTIDGMFNLFESYPDFKAFQDDLKEIESED